MKKIDSRKLKDNLESLRDIQMPEYRKPTPLKSVMDFLCFHKDEIKDYDLKANIDGIDLKIVLKKELES